MSPNINRPGSGRAFVPFSKPSIGPEEERELLEVLRSGWLTSASKSMEFERRFADRVGADFALAVNSGTAGLHLALEAFGVTAGDTVITSTYTFTATAEVIRYLGAHPVFVDIAPDSYTLDTDEVLAAVRKEKPAAIMPVHIGGEPCDMATLLELSNTHRIPIIEDAAHAFPGDTVWGCAGTIGDAGVYSFYANKPITTGEGGMVVTSDEEKAERMSTMRLHGIDRTVWDRYTTARAKSWEYDIVAPGYKYNMPDTAAAIGLAQLKKADRFLKRRREIATRYTEAFSTCSFLETPPDAVGHSWHLYLLSIVPEALRIDRDEFAGMLLEKSVGTSVHYKPLHLMSYYRTTYSLDPNRFPRSNRRFSTVLSLPVYPDLTDEDVEYVVESIIAIGKRAKR